MARGLRKPASARLTKACSATSSPVPAATSARWPTPSRSPSPGVSAALRGPRPPARHRRA
ncbi:hypothetical protein ACPA9J_09525 [Pseudomonas aeruginosa]